jgi:maltooligosyltrehalose synthase
VGTDATRLDEDPELRARVPLATYRLQFSPSFAFEDAEGLLPYLETLGVSDVYASSYLAARPVSSHGYDVVDHNALNPAIGSEASYGPGSPYGDFFDRVEPLPRKSYTDPCS